MFNKSNPGVFSLSFPYKHLNDKKMSLSGKPFPFVNYLPYNYEHNWVYICQVYDCIL